MVYSYVEVEDRRPRRNDVAICPGCGEQVRFDGEDWYLEGRMDTSATRCGPRWVGDGEYVEVRHGEHIDLMIAERPDVVVTPFGRVDLRTADTATKLLAAQYLAMQRKR